MKKRTLVWLIVAIVVLVLVIVWAVWALAFKKPTFHAVYLSTGDLYFGQVVQFPHFGVKQVYTLQVNPENEENPLSIQRFKNVFWGPSDFIKINREQVVWTVELASEGQLAQLITENPELLPTNTGAGIQQQGGGLPTGGVPTE